MAGTYGTRDATRFSPGGNLGRTQYYTLIDEKGNITVKSPTLSGDVVAKINPKEAANADRTVGSIPKNGSFVYIRGAEGAGVNAAPTFAEIEHFSNPVNLNLTKNQAVITVTKSGVPNARQLIFTNTPQPTKSPPQRPAPAPKAGESPAEAPAAGGAAPAAGGEGEKINSTIAETGKPLEPTNLGKGLLKYPIDMRDDQDTIAFTVLEIAKLKDDKIQLSKRGFSMAYQPATTDLKTVATVILPIQPSISDSNSVDWGSGTLNEIERQFANAALKFMDDGQLKPRLDELNKGLRKGINDGSLGKLGQIYAAEQAVGVQGLLSRATGQVLNPNLELLFNGPALRPFNFVFKLSPRSEKEATDVRKIIRFFKENMAVRKSNTELFVKSPYVFRVMYNHPIKPTKDNPTPERTFHKSINRVKTCALQSFNVDYTPLGSYMTYEDEAASMVSYNISLQFTEIEPVYSTDYVMPEDEIGY
jgi:hypothetical protein